MRRRRDLRRVAPAAEEHWRTVAAASEDVSVDAAVRAARRQSDPGRMVADDRRRARCRGEDRNDHRWSPTRAPARQRHVPGMPGAVSPEQDRRTVVATRSTGGDRRSVRRCGRSTARPVESQTGRHQSSRTGHTFCLARSRGAARAAFPRRPSMITVARLVALGVPRRSGVDT